MKRVLKALVPIMLALCVLLCTAWYLFVYDRDFTRDLLLTQARQFEEAGDQRTAAWLYDLAYYHSGENDAIAIELARQYESVGNYTKAEYTLANAISNNPTANLYRELSRVYVAQDKLLDAVNMLDRIADPAIKSNLDSLRPGVPSPSCEPGLYSEYIRLQLRAGDHTVYATTDGVYPTMARPPFTEGADLPIGKTTVTALSVSSDGLVSPLAVYSYIVGGIVEPVTFADKAVEEALRLQLEIPEGVTVYTNDLWDVTEFVMPEGAQVYTDLALLTNLETLTVENGKAGQLSVLSANEHLQSLSIPGYRPTEQELAIIAALPELQLLNVRECALSSLNSLSGATELVYLDLTGNSVRDLKPLAGMTKLQELYLGSNALTDLAPLVALSELKILDVSHNSLGTIAPLCGLTGLTELNASYNSFNDLDKLGQLINLRNLNLSHNSLTDVTALSTCIRMERLDISGNALTDITSLFPLEALTYLNFANNQVAQLPAFAPETPLVTIDGSYNLLVSVTELTGLTQLNNVLLDYNEGITDLLPLDKCPRLVLVNAFGTQVSDVSFLLHKSVIVNFDPTV